MIRKARPSKLNSLAANRWVWAGLVVVVVVGGWLIFRPQTNKNTTIPSTTPLSGARTPSSGSQNSNPSANSSTPNPVANPSVSSGSPPATPFGDFVSSHHASSSTSTAEASTCNTTPGASCYIQFTKGDEVKKLSTQVADAKGSVIWYWDIKTAGLDSGSWTVTAVASLNGQTTTAKDAMELVVQ